jgi:hypothetical protein
MADKNKKYWKSTKPSSLREKQRGHLRLLLAFANLELQPDKKDNLNDRAISDFIRFVVSGDVGSHRFSPLVDKSEIERLKKLETAAGDPEAIGIIQHHLRNRIFKIMEYMVSYPVRMPLWEMKGAVRLIINPGNHFTEEFTLQVDDFDNVNKQLTDLIDLRLAELIRDLDLHPKRFRECLKCGRLFYQPTSREKNYCSVKCAGAVRQARFQKKLKGGE